MGRLVTGKETEPVAASLPPPSALLSQVRPNDLTALHLKPAVYFSLNLCRTHFLSDNSKFLSIL